MPWKPGQSDNPSGRPKINLELRDLARRHTKLALETLVRVAKDERAPASARVSAATALLDRGYGRPVQALEHSGPESAPESIPDAVAERILAAIGVDIRNAPEEARR